MKISVLTNNYKTKQKNKAMAVMKYHILNKRD